MANVQQITRDYLLRARTEGVAETTAAAQRLGSATDALATKTETQSKSAISAAAALERQQRQLDLNYRSMKQFEQSQRDLDRAQQQGLISTARHAELMALATARFGSASRAQQALSTTTQEIQNRISAAAGATGSFGSVLATLGPIGIGVAAVIGTVVLALNAMSNASHNLAEKAEELRRFSEATGLTATQIQALKVEAAKFGVTSEEAQTAIQNFTARFNDLRIGQGELLTQIRRLNPALADQMAGVTNAGDALTLFGQALAKVDDVFQRNALVKAATGRGGISSAQFLANLNVDAVTKSFVESGKAIDENLIKRIAQLDIDIKKTSAQASAALASIFSVQVLEGELAFAKEWLGFATSVKNFSISGDLRYLLETVLKIRLGGQGTLLGALGVDYQAGYTAPSLVNPRRTSAPEILVPTFNTGRGAADNTGGTRGQLAPTPQYTLESLQKQIAAMGDAATFAQKLDAAQKQLAISGREAGLSAEQMAKAENVLKGSFALQQMQATISALASVATPTEQYTLRLAELVQSLNRGAISQQTFNRAAAGLRNEFALQALQEMVSTLGAATTPAEQFKLKVAELEQKLASGRITLDTFNRSLADFQQEQDVAKLQRTVAALGSAATATEQYNLRIAELRQQLDRGQISQQTFNRAVAAANPVTQQLTAGAEQFATTLVDGLMDGKSLVDSLKSAFDGLAKSMANAAIKDLFSGNFEKAGIEAVVAIGAKLASNFFDTTQQKELEKAKLAWSGMTDQVHNFNTAADGFDLSQFVSAIQQIKNTALDLIKAAMKAGDTAGAIQLIFAAVKSVNSQVDQFIKPKGDSAGEKIAATNNEAQQIIGELNSLNQQYNLGLNRTTDILAAAAAKVADIQASVTKTLQADINTATGKSWINDLQTLVDETKTLQAQATATNTDPTLIGRRFEVMAQKIIDGAQLTGDAFGELQTLFPDLTGKVHEYTAAVQDNADALKKAADATAKSIVDYLNGLTSGPGSTLAPTAVLSNAQSSYNANYALAIGGNADAQAKFVSLADNLEKAARAVYASGQGYQDIRNQIINQGLALPAVQQTTDPTVVALRDTITAIQANTTSTSSNTTSTDALTGTTGPTGDGLIALLANIQSMAGQVVTLATNIQTNAGEIAALGTSVQTSSGEIAALGTSVQTSSGQIVTLGNDTSATAYTISALSDFTAGAVGQISNLGGNVYQSSQKIIDLTNQLGGTGGASERLLELADTIGTGGDQALRAKLIAMAGELFQSSVNIADLAGNSSTSAINIGSLAEKASTSAANINTLAGNVSDSAGKIVTLGNNIADPTTGAAARIVTLAGNVRDSAGQIVTLGTNVGTTAGQVVTMGNDIGSATSGIGTVVGNTGATATRIGVPGDANSMAGILNILQNNFVAGGATILPNSGNVGNLALPPGNNSDAAITALRKIVFNTAIIAANTNKVSSFQGYGVFAEGGWITGGTPGRDSVPIMAMPHEFIVNESATRALTSAFGPSIMDTINAGRLPTNVVPFPAPATPHFGGAHDNGALLAEVKRLNDKIDRLERVVAGSGANIARAVVESGEHVADTVETQTDTLAAQERQSNRQRKVA